MDEKRPMSEEVRRAYASHYVERTKLIAGGFLLVTAAALFLIDTSVHFLPPGIAVGLSLALFGLGLLTYRTTALYKTVKSGPRVPRRIRLPFDSHVEYSVQQAPVESRTNITADGLPPKAKDEGAP